MDDGPRLVIWIGAAVALAGLAIGLLSDGPFLGADGVNAGVLMLGIGLFAAMFAIPFALERGLQATELDRDRRWERALLRWGAVAGVVVACGALLALAFGLDGSSMGGAAAIVVLVDGILVAGTLVAWMFSN